MLYWVMPCLAAKLTAVSAAVQERARTAEEGSALELASRQPLLDQLNADLASWAFTSSAS